MAELYVGLENNQKILIPTSSEARSGNPLGTILAIHSNVVPYGYLPCNGVAFDENQYPALYALLGDNHTPYSYDKSRLGDYEDMTLSNNSASPTVMPYDGFLTVQMFAGVANGTIDGGVYVNGTLHRCYVYNGNQWTTTVGVPITIPVKRGDSVYVNSSTVYTSAKVRYYTHFNVIKATSGLEETQQDYVLQSLLEADSYSTEEVATGKKWIDGKMIYRKVFTGSWSFVQGSWNSTSISNADKETITDCFLVSNSGTLFRDLDASRDTGNDVLIRPSSAGVNVVIVGLEYTKAD